VAEQPASNFHGKEIDNRENQNERESRRHQWDYSYRRLRLSNQHLFSKKGKTTMKIETNVKAGEITLNHNQTAARSLKVRSKVKAGGMPNHNRAVANGLKVKSGVKAGIMQNQHNQNVTRGLKVKSGVKAGIMENQHNQTMARGLKVKSGIKAGQAEPPTVRD